MKNKEWTIAFCVYICIGTMQGLKISKGLAFYISHYYIGMGHYNESH